MSAEKETSSVVTVYRYSFNFVYRNDRPSCHQKPGAYHGRFAGRDVICKLRTGSAAWAAEAVIGCCDCPLLGASNHEPQR